MNICSSCQKGVLSPIIKSSPFMIIKESCTQNELDQSTPFTQHGTNKYGHEEHTTSYYLNLELGKVGLQLSTMSLMSLYMHQPPKVGRSKEQQAILTGCAEYSLQQVIHAAKDMKVILISGAELVKTLTSYNTSDIYGLVVKSYLLPNVPVLVACPNTDKILRSPIGEMRNALRVFAENIKIYKEYTNE